VNEVLYPLKFDPIYKQIVWGGTNISRFFHRNISLDKVAESWELCCRAEGTSIVSSGNLKGMSFQNVINKYRGKLLGEKTYNTFGTRFPLLIKLIDANENLSVQVHPGDAYARINGDNCGKNELWYILDAKENSRLVYGVNENETKADFSKAVSENNTEQALHIVNVKPGDAFYVPAGKVHAILSGILIAEIQQNSNTTYRIYDWGRVDKNGIGRTLNTDKAFDVIDFDSLNLPAIIFRPDTNQDFSLDVVLRSEYFNVDKISVHPLYNSTTTGGFIIFMCIKGSGTILYDGGSCEVALGETVLFPACIGKFVITGVITLLSIYML
jgi:mannose-6-phosphate isomerase